jgi:hypothetical protein
MTMLTGLVAAAIVFVVLFVILGVTLWVSILAAVAVWAAMHLVARGPLHRTTT